ncbi:MAG: two-component sensor histidine kinase [Oscillospiraceae bacterium]|nr:two-component sensor histidine kinase [Oscillospiraceae bacterium]
MTSKIFRSTVFVAVVVLLCSLGIVMGVLYNHFTGVQVEQLKDELSLAVTGTEQYGNAFLENVEADRFRVTWIDTDGTVLFDTQVDQNTMENHADREEIREAFATGSGSAVRNSSTLTEQTYYEARRLADGTVLRISANQASAWALMMDLLWPIILIAVLAIGLSALLARRMAKNIVEPMNKLDLEHPLSNNTYDELSPLLRRINQQHLQIAAQMRKLQRKTDEFIQITSHMQEGLVVLDKETHIRSINFAAMKIFNAEESCVGSSFFQVNRSNALRQALNDALDRGHGSAVLELEGKAYRFDMSSIQSDGNLLGAVILAVDVTESQNAEQMRREFSANVSHELKTPLQGIIGSAELLESGMVKAEDTPRFVGHIRKEASRLVNLIEDIIRLSQLDEGVELPAEQVGMLALAEDVQEILAPSAAEKNVTIDVTGNGFTINGVRRMLQEILYNLCDNAIKYNVPGGSVMIHAENNRLVVSDTGIGIPAEHKDRIFERFYRVDKSHSKASGGTGLGLSIVKHATAYHKAEISLESTPGKGTTITIQF